MNVLEETVDAVCEWNNCSINRKVVFASINVIGNYLQGEARCRIKTILRQENCTYSFWILEMAELESDVLLKTVNIAINCCVVPSWRDNKLYSSIYVINSVQQMIEFIVKSAYLLVTIFVIVHELWVCKFACIWKCSDIFPASCKHKNRCRNVLD